VREYRADGSFHILSDRGEIELVDNANDPYATDLVSVVRLPLGQRKTGLRLDVAGFMQISEAARVSGVSARSLRHYEDEGLITPGRCSNGFRDYCRSTIDKVLVIRELVGSGLPVRLIKAVLPRLTDEPEAVCAEFLAEVQEHRDRLTARIAVLTAQQEALDVYLREARQPAA